MSGVSNNCKLVLFYADWCGHSQLMLPIWEQFEEFLIDNDVKIPFEKINSNEVHEYKHLILSYPTIALQYNDFYIEMPTKYPKTVDGLLKFVAHALHICMPYMK